MKYNPAQIEKKWQEVWESQRLYQADDKSDKPKYYSLDMFPYPSGDLHIGHWYNYTGPDVFARFKRMNGYNVLRPIGFDAFGLPAENAAIKRGLDPNDWTQSNIATMIAQLKSTGVSFDWSRMVDTSQPEYYKWTQWIFIQLFKQGLAYRAKGKVNWCETDQTVLANEQVEDGMCWRCGNPVTQKELEQWYFKTTHYADELHEDLESLDWPEKTKLMQKNWIGRSTGANVVFSVVGAKESIEVFTTRPDTLYGVSYLALTPSHPLIKKVTTPDNKQVVEEYQALSLRKSEREIQEKNEKSGVFTGGFVIHPMTGEKVPVWVADYVLAGYGTGAVMGVPAHDQRDWDFATLHGLPIVEVVEGGEVTKQPFAGYGRLINSQQFDGMDYEEACEQITRELRRKGLGDAMTTYRLRDWLVSRQRYWGAPIPMIECKQCGLVAVPESDLPVKLPREVDFTPKGVPPLATNKDFMRVACPGCQGEAQRVADTMDTFVDSSWYFLRYVDPNNEYKVFDQDKVNKWMPVDMYVGGAEHTVLHLLYSRFFTKALRDMGLLNINEPFHALRHQGMILGPDHQKMSKSKGNVVNPDELVQDFGVDSVRLQLLFIGPFDQGGAWQLSGIHGSHRFLQRVWAYQQDKHWNEATSSTITLQLNNAIAKVCQDIRDFKFNTAIATLMSLINTISKVDEISKPDWEKFLTLLAPFSPHITEELWQQLGHHESIHLQNWPKVSEEELEDSSASARLAVQVNGRVRAVIDVDSEATQEAVLEKAQANEVVARYVADAVIKKVIYIPGKVLNLVV